ncbi:MAG: deoxyribonuclease IV [Gemmataceae bacterium]|nr:deoxyribonuclease IV [Gemmataceae bacterium]
MPLLGAHNSIAGGYHNALITAHHNGCATVQIFTKNNNQWAGKPLTADEIALFREKLAEFKLRLPMAHAAYLINLASPQPELYRRSVEAFVVETQRAEALGLAYLVVHPGTPTDGDRAAGLRRVARALDETHRRCRKCRVMVLLETTAGQGSSLGHRFEDLAGILDRVKDPDRLGVCLDTCHVFAAGYPLAPPAAYKATMMEFDRVVGLSKLRAFHLNDSQKPLGSRVDRHAHIGQGCLGLEPFRLLLNDPRFRAHPMVLETPKEGPNGEDMDPVNLATLRGLLHDAKPAASRRGKTFVGNSPPI